MMFLIFKKTIFIRYLLEEGLPLLCVHSSKSLYTLKRIEKDISQTKDTHLQIETQQTQEQQNNRTQTGEQEQRNNNK